jgi:hypothetical protein
MGLIRALGPLGLYRGDSGWSGCPTEIQNKKFQLGCVWYDSLILYLVGAP